MDMANSQENQSQHDDDERDYVRFHGSRLDRPKNVAREFGEQLLDWRLLVGACGSFWSSSFQGNGRPLRDMRIVR